MVIPGVSPDVNGEGSRMVLKIHIVQKGETLRKIADHYTCTVEEIAKINPQLSKPNQVLPGMKLRIPSDSKKVRGAKVKQKPKTMLHTPKRPMGLIEGGKEKRKQQQTAWTNRGSEKSRKLHHLPANGAYLHCSRCQQLMMVERPVYLSAQNEPPHAMRRRRWF